MSHVTHMNESCHTYEWVMTRITWRTHQKKILVCLPIKCRKKIPKSNNLSISNHIESFSPRFGGKFSKVSSIKISYYIFGSQLTSKNHVKVFKIFPGKESQNSALQHTHLSDPHWWQPKFTHTQTHAHTHTHTNARADTDTHCLLRLFISSNRWSV